MSQPVSRRDALAAVARLMYQACNRKLQGKHDEASRWAGAVCEFGNLFGFPLDEVAAAAIAEAEGRGDSAAAAEIRSATATANAITDAFGSAPETAAVIAAVLRAIAAVTPGRDAQESAQAARKAPRFDLN